ncbi:MAG: hypothetical protein RMI04_09195 [Thermofilaceae archaeon]|nr:hypothetical protein [Thermofilaceae archaeon]
MWKGLHEFEFVEPSSCAPRKIPHPPRGWGRQPGNSTHEKFIEGLWFL